MSEEQKILWDKLQALKAQVEEIQAQWYEVYVRDNQAAENQRIEKERLAGR